MLLASASRCRITTFGAWGTNCGNLFSSSRFIRSPDSSVIGLHMPGEWLGVRGQEPRAPIMETSLGWRGPLSVIGLSVVGLSLGTVVAGRCIAGPSRMSGPRVILLALTSLYWRARERSGEKWWSFSGACREACCERLSASPDFAERQEGIGMLDRNSANGRPRPRKAKRARALSQRFMSSNEWSSYTSFVFESLSPPLAPAFVKNS